MINKENYIYFLMPDGTVLAKDKTKCSPETLKALTKKYKPCDEHGNVPEPKRKKGKKEDDTD